MIEEFREIPGYEGLYLVSNVGNVMNIKSGRLLNPILNKDGYLVLGIYKDKIQKHKQIHQLVAMAFLNHTPNGHLFVVDHINGVRTDNRSENLQIVTHRENSTTCHLKNKSTFSSKYVGVHWHEKNRKWVAKIRMHYYRKHLGYFETEIEASNAYQNALQSIINVLNLKLD